MKPARRSKRNPRWPGAMEIIASAFSTYLLAQNLRILQERGRLQGSTAYYFGSENVMAFHVWAIAVNLVWGILVLLWIFTGWGQALRRILIGLAALSVPLIWWELVIASSIGAEAVYRLDSLPFQPVSSLGLIGAQAYLTYLIFRLPDGQMSPWAATFIKVGFAICLWLVQLGLWHYLFAPR